MAPPFIRAARQRALPPEPVAENPFETAMQRWAALHEYATKVADVARETDETNKALAAENESLRRENERLSDQMDKISREQRATSAFAENLRARLKSIEEQIATTLAESLQHAQHAMREPAPEVHEIEREIARAAVARPMPQSHEPARRNGYAVPPTNAFT